MKKEKGYTLIELIISIFLASLFLPALVFVFSFSLKSAGEGENYTKAYAIAQQQMEAIYYLKENNAGWDWENDPLYNSGDDYYQPRKVADVWELGEKVTGSALAQDDNGFVSSVKILEVYRDAYDTIVDSGDLDPDSRLIIVKVSWKETGIPTSIDLVSYVTNH